MRFRVSAFSRSLVRSLILAALFVPVQVISAQTFVAPTMPAAVEQVSVAAEGLSAIIGGLLEKGRSLEVTGRWADALSHYEAALHEHPEDQALQARFDLARLTGEVLGSVLSLVSSPLRQPVQQP